MTVSTETPAALTAEPATEPRVFDSWINIPYLPGEVTPDPSVVQRFKRGDSAYEGGQTMDDVIAEMDRLEISGGVLTKVPRDITPPFVHGIRSGEAVLREACERLATIQAELPRALRHRGGTRPSSGLRGGQARANRRP